LEKVLVRQLIPRDRRLEITSFTIYKSNGLTSDVVAKLLTVRKKRRRVFDGIGGDESDTSFPSQCTSTAIECAPDERISRTVQAVSLVCGRLVIRGLQSKKRLNNVPNTKNEQKTKYTTARVTHQLPLRVPPGHRSAPSLSLCVLVRVTLRVSLPRAPCN